MASKIKVDQIAGSSGSTVTVPTGQTFTITDGLAVASLPTVTVAKGGTNLTSFTAGDVLYATGSTTLAKLPKGIAAQTLKMNAGATAPEWVTVAAASSDYVRLATIADAGSGTPTYVDMTSVFSSTYKFYRLYGYNIELSGSVNIEVSFLVGGTEQTTNYYYNKGSNMYGNQTTASHQFEDRQNGDGFEPIGNWGQNTGDLYGCHFEMTFFNPNATGTYSTAHWKSNSNQGTGQMINRTGTGYYAGADIAATGIRIKPASGTWTKGVFNLYGLKAS